MLEFLQNLFSSEGFMPHGYCILWKPELMWLHVGSDSLIALAYYSIPFTLFYVVRKRQDLAFKWAFLMFGAFIFACGTTHLMEVWTLWLPTYRLEGSIKLFTAGISMATAVMLVPLIPKALALPSPAQLEAANRKLGEEIVERQRVEEALRQAHNKLEQRVQERTAELVKANEALQAEITERKQAEEVIRRNEAWLSSLINTTQDAAISIDRQGRVVRFNPSAERIFGYTKAEVEGQKVNILMAEPYASQHEDYIKRYEQTREPHAIGRIRTVAARRKNGEVFPIELSVTEVKVDDEVRYGAFIRDISEKVRLQEQLIERERLAAIGTTAAKFAHEIGNPLNGMYMTAQLLQRHLAKHGDTLDNRVSSNLRNLMSETARLNQLLHEFRSLSRRREFDFRPTALDLMVAEVLTAETPHYTARGIRVEKLLPPDLPLVMADGDKLKQVVLNLCKNAAEAMPRGGTLTVRAHNSEEQISLEVTDTGVGIAAGVNIFEPFTTTKSEGTGLGLAVVQQIVAAHGGTITYNSEPGQGTTFTLVLPITQLGMQESTR